MRQARSRSARTRSRRVLLVTHHYAPESGAPQRRWSALAGRLVHAGVALDVLAPPPHYPSGRLDAAHAADHLRPGAVATGAHGERVVRVRFREHSSGLLSRTVDQLVAAASSVTLGLRHFRRGERPGVVIGTVPGIPSMFAAWLLARRFRAAFVVEMRDAWPDLIRPSGILNRAPGHRPGLRGVATAAVHRLITRLQSRADLVVTTTETFAEVLRERGVRSVAVVRNGTAFQPLARTDPAGAGPRERPVRAVYLGTIGRSQGLEVVVRAAAKVAERGLPLEVRIVGAGNDVGHLRYLAQVLGAPVSVEPGVPHEEVRALYEWADTSVVSLRDWEPFEWTIPSKLYEVMASGNYVTACVAGESAELVRSLGAGAVVPPGDVDALADLWSAWAASGVVPVADPAAAAWVAANADDDVLAARYLALIDDLVGGTP